MEQSKKTFLPMSHGVTFLRDMCTKTLLEIGSMQKTLYASAIVPIIYAMLCMRSDISYALSVTSRFQVNPNKGH